jgi:hypothetical protein
MIDALFDALRGVASKTKDAARAHLDEQRQFSTRQVLHFVHVDPDELTPMIVSNSRGFGAQTPVRGRCGLRGQSCHCPSNVSLRAA